MSEKITVILTEDNLSWRQNIRAELRETDIEIIAEAGDGHELLEHLEKLNPNVILLDLSMPGMDGNETLDHIRNRHPSAKVLILTTFETPELAESYIKRGASGYMGKSTVYDELETAIKRIHRGGIYFKRSSGQQRIDLTDKNKVYLQMISEGKKRDEIAKSLNITAWGVDRQRKKVIKSLNTSESGLLKRIFELGFQFFPRFKRK